MHSQAEATHISFYPRPKPAVAGYMGAPKIHVPRLRGRKMTAVFTLAEESGSKKPQSHREMGAGLSTEPGGHFLTKSSVRDVL